MLRCCFLLVIAASAISGPRERRKLAEDRDTFNQKNLDCHNKYRAIHQVGPLEYDDKLMTYAQNYADELAAAEPEILNHSGGPYGENIYAGSGSFNGTVACEGWYSEVKNYRDYSASDPENFLKVEHFTQLVWKETTKMGIGIATGASGNTYVVASYSPPGNLDEEYNNNVFYNL